MENSRRIAGQRIVFVSNRLPVTIERRKGKVVSHPSTGGLATALYSITSRHESWWLGWPGAMSFSKEVESKLVSECSCYPVFLSRKDVEKYYLGFCNRTLWPLFHYFPRTTKYDSAEWDQYRKVNQMFCDKLLEAVNPDDIIWIHDYHLMLLPSLLREHLPNATIGFFLHIPFPPFEIFRLLPWRREILNGILGADLIGFQTYEYSNHFLDTVLFLLGKQHELGTIDTGNRTVNAGVFPIGIDFQKYFEADRDPQVDREVRRFKGILGENRIVLSIDRLDYTKGIPERLEGFDTFLSDNPAWHGKVTLILVVSPSRETVQEYLLLKKQIEELVGKINGKYSKIGWSPILYIHQTLQSTVLAALYSIADVALITPIRDGMNLIAKEYVAACSNGLGVLILSEMAGAAKELGEAIVVNPNSKQEISNALSTALRMPPEEQISRNTEMQKRLRSYNVEFWANRFLDQLLQTKELQESLRAKTMKEKLKSKLTADYQKSDSRLILLDYDGTLVPFAKSREKPMPDDKLRALLAQLAEPKQNEIVIISGRGRNTLDQWFGNLNVSLIGEHGVWYKRKGNASWEIMEPMKSDWKKEIRPIMEVYADRVPKSFIEEKEFSIAWHYRNVVTEQGELQARELMALLASLSAYVEIGVMRGNKVIEVKNAGINKGRAVLRILSKQNFQFVLAIGDDYTDESMFLVLPENAYSIKVGVEPSHAKFYLTEQSKVIPLLKELHNGS
jgi:trehalose 6-phosphate synthase/phosphatase